MEVGFSAPERVLKALRRIGRTEDVCFSPSGDRIAIAGASKNRILLLNVERQGDELAIAMPSREFRTTWHIRTVSAG
jgi:hypothetical protein